MVGVCFRFNQQAIGWISNDWAFSPALNGTMLV